MEVIRFDQYSTMNSMFLSEGPTITSLITRGKQFPNSPSWSKRNQPICGQVNNLIGWDKILEISKTQTGSKITLRLKRRQIICQLFVFDSDTSVKCCLTQKHVSCIQMSSNDLVLGIAAAQWSERRVSLNNSSTPSGAPSHWQSCY